MVKTLLIKFFDKQITMSKKRGVDGAPPKELRDGIETGAGKEEEAESSRIIVPSVATLKTIFERIEGDEQVLLEEDVATIIEFLKGVKTRLSKGVKVPMGKIEEAQLAMESLTKKLDAMPVANEIKKLIMDFFNLIRVLINRLALEE